MGNLRIGNSKLKGEVKIPPSKSMAHRAIICASLGSGVSRINNIDYSDDMIATIEGMKVLGAKINKYDDYLEVIGIYSKGSNMNSFRTIDCNESGSTLRFLVPISLLFHGMSKFIGKGNLGKRPLTTYFEIFKEQGIKYFGRDGELDLLIEGKLKPGEFKILGNVSSQFITGLLLTLPLLNGDSKIIITTEMQSKGYVDLTISCMKDFGVEIINKDYKEFIIKGNQNYNSRDYRVEGDYSQAAFYLSANALGSKVLVNDIDLKSLQGDKEIVDILERMGVTFKSENNTLTGIVKDKLKSTIIDGSQCPDIIPILAAVASLSSGTTEIINAERLRIKECDRLKAVTSELSKLGANIKEREDGLIIEGKEELQGGAEVWSFRDHRIAMTLAIAATRCKEAIIIKDFECVAKSYPKFFDDFKMLGGDVHEWNMGK
ncbi:3-phosphoshikimate 1-carboxyvinyltransferase [Clostridium septicum]|uniref:3-phosphoshikimate 1-carboxyvinyltransferase n=1 Tax=Clostridium septicum TaxID=1504 RepID=A0A9N7PLN8_CLOSE|nr:3-phosphoshikimate 1-carboxyvinyltransferase [Clostridium septicum]AYE34966.1 3-phosphoshikimate 1-carboxyvinyltransferase [Clostridium septicum]MDU1314644.1 3-phosphoshikimate 1-carboxyvinyltransferase [Clostridium septicum]QAS60359.1 3-phosphoshikimate 1-carboxyvinyltransferase [Clostridium septicum]UEC20385.1 3-phosphoshikimate 1-carboxyvinyltransferase [Clostridium septicum]USS01560.1 3-phosphoshikimate 1-carboxyvinyltransferase [Clostridium septicum]